MTVEYSRGGLRYNTILHASQRRNIIVVSQIPPQCSVKEHSCKNSFYKCINNYKLSTDSVYQIICHFPWIQCVTILAVMFYAFLLFSQSSWAAGSSFALRLPLSFFLSSSLCSSSKANLRLSDQSKNG